ncbi:MAG: ArsR/SmtB family transcription factor [bacterium]|jgi:ArsR family transcriptional regulator
MVLNQDEKDIRWEELATIVKAMAHPVRLLILDELCKGAKCVTDVQQIVDVSQPNLSQHLSALKRAQLIGSHANGPLRCYYLLRPSLVKRLLRELKKEHPISVRPREVVIQEVQLGKMKSGK